MKEVPDPLPGPEVKGTQELVTADIASLGRKAMLDILATVDQDPGWHRRSLEQETVQRRSRDPEACPLRAPPPAAPAAAEAAPATAAAAPLEPASDGGSGDDDA